MEDFALCVTNVVQLLLILGDLEPKAKIVAKYLRVARPRYRQLVVSMDTLLTSALFRSQNVKCKIFINRLHGVLNVVEK